MYISREIYVKYLPEFLDPKFLLMLSISLKITSGLRKSFLEYRNFWSKFFSSQFLLYYRTNSVFTILTWNLFLTLNFQLF